MNNNINERHTIFFDRIKYARRTTSKGTIEALNDINDTVFLRIIDNFAEGTTNNNNCRNGLMLSTSSSPSLPLLDAPIENAITSVSADGKEVTIPLRYSKNGNFCRFFTFEFFDSSAAKLFCSLFLQLLKKDEPGKVLLGYDRLRELVREKERLEKNESFKKKRGHEEVEEKEIWSDSDDEEEKKEGEKDQPSLKRRRLDPTDVIEEEGEEINLNEDFLLNQFGESQAF